MHLPPSGGLNMAPHLVPHNAGNSIGVPLPQLPTIVPPPQVAAPLCINSQLWAIRTPPRANHPLTVTYLLSNIDYWENIFPGSVFTSNMPVPSPTCKAVGERVQNLTIQTIQVGFDATPPPSNLTVTPLT